MSLYLVLKVQNRTSARPEKVGKAEQYYNEAYDSEVSQIALSHCSRERKTILSEKLNALKY